MTESEIKLAIEQVERGEAVLLDVRRKEEWDTGHARGAKLFPAERVLTGGEVPDLPKDKTIYTYCVSGGRAGRVRAELERQGFSDVHNLGGLLDWQEAGGEVEN
jgi:rhodanese-related sulfurtransferase